jgi:nucleotide-binding universal stress UspA family protein
MTTQSMLPEIRHILFATDGSDHAQRAAAVTASLALACHARVTVLHVFPTVSPDLGEPNLSNIIEAALEKSRTLVEAAAARLRAWDVAEVETDVVGNDAADGILTVAEVRQVDLIVIGARGLSALQSILQGSVSLSVTQRATCPVVVVK